jgi:hypothetical protein
MLREACAKKRLRGLFAALQKGDILLGDRAYGDYLTMASLPKQGVDVVARLHGGRKADYRKAIKRLGRHDGLFEWSKPYERSKLLTAAQWRKVPETIVVRLICFDAVIVKEQVPLRPHRNEPRAVKRRPKAYQLLNQPRHRFKEVSHRCRYRKSQTPKTRALI